MNKRCDSGKGIIHPDKVGGFNSRKKCQLMVMDYHTGLFDPIRKKRIDSRLPKIVQQSGIYKPTKEWLKYYKHYARKSSIESVEKELNLR